MIRNEVDRGVAPRLSMEDKMNQLLNAVFFLAGILAWGPFASADSPEANTCKLVDYSTVLKAAGLPHTESPYGGLETVDEKTPPETLLKLAHATTTMESGVERVKEQVQTDVLEYGRQYKLINSIDSEVEAFKYKDPREQRTELDRVKAAAENDPVTKLKYAKFKLQVLTPMRKQSRLARIEGAQYSNDAAIYVGGNNYTESKEAVEKERAVVKDWILRLESQNTPLILKTDMFMLTVQRAALAGSIDTLRRQETCVSSLYARLVSAKIRKEVRAIEERTITGTMKLRSQ